MLWCQKLEIKWGDSPRQEERRTRCPVMLQKLMLSVIFLAKDNATEEFNGPVRVIIERSRERFVCMHQKKLQVVCSAYKKKRIRIICPLLPSPASLLPSVHPKWVIFMSEEEWRPRFFWQGHASSNITPEGLIAVSKRENTKFWNRCIWTELQRDCVQAGVHSSLQSLNCIWKMLKSTYNAI